MAAERKRETELDVRGKSKVTMAPAAAATVGINTRKAPCQRQQALDDRGRRQGARLIQNKC